MNNRRTLALLIAGTSLNAGLAFPAFAQDLPPAPSGQEAGQAAASNAQAANSGGVNTIMVTAQRRDQNMQDVPISVDAATGDTLDTLGLRTTSDIGMIAPSVTFSVGLGGGAPTIRGVGGTGAGTDEAANSLYIDGVYMPSPQGMLFQFNNIERVEVLKGPQGTLFGRNASGGLIHIITEEPGQELQGRFQIGYANYDTIRAAATISGGIADSLAVSLSGVYENQGDGWGQNFTTGEDAYRGRFYGVRGRALWDIGPDTSLNIAAHYAYSRPAPTQGGQILPGEIIFGGFSALGFYDQTMNLPPRAINENTNVAVTLRHDFGWATATSITSRDVSTSDLSIDADLGPLNRLNVLISGPKRSWTQEFQFASPSSSSIQWIAGLFYYRGAWFQDPSLTTGLAVAPLAFRQSDSRQLTNSYAAYGQATVPFTDSTNFTLGLRYTIDQRQHDVTTTNSNPATIPTVFPTENSEDRKLTWRIAVDQVISDDVLAYASVSRGFKSGLYNIGNPGNPPVEPQTIDAYEIGLKTDLFDRNVRLNLSAFRYDIENIQLRTTVPPNPAPIFYNAAQSRVYGVEADLQVYVSSRFSLQGNVAYLSGEYTSFPRAVYFAVNSAPAFGLTVLPPSDATGNETVFTPHWVTNLSAQYELPTSVGNFTLGGAWSYNSGYFFDPQNRLSNPAYHMVNATLTWEPNDNFFVRAWVNNLLDEQYFATIQPSNFGDLYFPAPPATYGVTLGTEF